MKGNESLYTIPLRDVYEKPRKRRAKLAIKEIKKFVKRHAKLETYKLVKIANEVNAVIWKGSIEKPPRKIKVKVVKKENYTYVLLPEQKIEDVIKVKEKESEEKKDMKKEQKEEKKEQKETKEEKKVKEIKEEQKTEKKEEKKKESKEHKKNEEKENKEKHKKEEKKKESKE